MDKKGLVAASYWRVWAILLENTNPCYTHRYSPITSHMLVLVEKETCEIVYMYSGLWCTGRRI